MLDRLPERIPMPDRLWFALAAYNLGLSHVESARLLTEKDGANADNWAEVKQRLPQLRQRKYYRQTRTGYARGDMAVYYVENIRRYYDTLLWVDERKQAEQQQAAQKPTGQIQRKSKTAATATTSAQTVTTPKPALKSNAEDKKSEPKRN
jgi:membrane-bound lytic murein transglycosylase F